MTKDEARDKARAIPIGEYLETITTKKGRKYVCPICGSGTGPKGTAAGSVDPRTNKYSCFACNNKELDIFDLVGAMERLEPAQAFDRVYTMYGLKDGQTPQLPRVEAPRVELPQVEAPGLQKVQAYIKRGQAAIKEAPEAINYLLGRGMDPASIERFGLGYDPQARRLIIPYNPAGTYYIARKLDSKDFIKPPTAEAGTDPLFNPGALDGPGPVYVVEAPLCAISIMQAGGQAIALVGTAYSKLTDHIKKHGTAAPLIIALDNDDPGQTAQAALLDELQGLGAMAWAENVAGEYKDPNEALQAEPQAFTARVLEGIARAPEILEAIEAEAREEEARKEAEARDEYQKTSAAAHLQAFADGIHASADTPYIPTGFSALDDILDGGLYEGLYIIGAISSLGKTTFALQIGDQIAAGGDHVLIFSLEMARYELMAKSISRLTAAKADPGAVLELGKTTRQITTGSKWGYYSEEEKRHIYEAMDDYEAYAGRVWIHEGIGDIGAAKIRETIETHIKLWGRRPVVIIDYLQILEPYDMRATDKQNTDKVVLELKKITRDHKLSILAISSFNRDNYKAPVNMASFKESGAIEYSSDVLIGLQLRGLEEGGKPVKDFDVDAAKSKEPREIQLKILKNRNGRTGNILDYDYYQKYNFFMECDRYGWE